MLHLLNAAETDPSEQKDNEDYENYNKSQIKNPKIKNNVETVVNDVEKETNVQVKAGSSTTYSLTEDSFIDLNDSTSWNLNIPNTKSLIVQHGTTYMQY